jgi:stage II sporulation protein GA (sporulation sigma-E factor processing peptidase)
MFIGFAFAGIMFALYTLIKPDNMAFNNGTVYFDISVRVFVICACICYVLIKLFLHFLKRFSADDRLCTLTLEINGKSVVLKGLVDTGNSLADVFTGKPVTTVEGLCLKRITDGIDVRRRGVVPVKTALGSGMLETVRADRMIIDYNGRRFSVLSPVIALSENELSGADYNALVNPDIFEIGRNENEKTANPVK